MHTYIYTHIYSLFDKTLYNINFSPFLVEHIQQINFSYSSYHILYINLNEDFVMKIDLMKIVSMHFLAT